MYSMLNHGRSVFCPASRDGSDAGTGLLDHWSMPTAVLTAVAAAVVVLGSASVASAAQSEDASERDRLSADRNAETATAQQPNAGAGIFLSVGGGARVPAAGDFTHVAMQEGVPASLFRGETSYSVGRSFQLDVSGGVMITPSIGVGVGFGRSSTDNTADFTMTFPNTVWLGEINESETESITTDPLARTETSVHISGVFEVPVEGPVSVAVLGGPSRISVDQEITADSRVVLNEARMLLLLPDFFDLRSAEIEEVSASAWGFHVGADLAYFFTENVGVGGLLRFSQATVELENGLQSTLDETTVTEEETAGGFQAVAGLRLRF